MIVVYRYETAVRTIMKILVHHVTSTTAAAVPAMQDTTIWLQSKRCFLFYENSLWTFWYKFFFNLSFHTDIGMVDLQDIKTHRLRRLHQNMNDHPHITTIRQALHLRTKISANENQINQLFLLQWIPFVKKITKHYKESFA